MTRNQNSKRIQSPIRSATTTATAADENLVTLPDLTGLKDEEKQHILNVLLRDEKLRSKHLARFMQLRKEVADLEQQPKPTSTSLCARCHTTFGYIFNTGDICPKCGAKVCKQCRLMYNVNDSGWLCQLCCKQMQLMSYSGEWIYSQQSNLRKSSVTASTIIRRSLSPSVSVGNLNGRSSSDTETEDITSASGSNRPSVQNTRSNQIVSNYQPKRMVVQTLTDEQKLNSVKRSVQQRPNLYDIPSSQPSSRLTRDLTLTSNNQAAGSSDDQDSLFDQSTNYTDRTSSSSVQTNTNGKDQGRTVSTPRSTNSMSTIQNHSNRPAVDCASVTSSEWGLDSERGESRRPSRNASIKFDSKQSLSSQMSLASSISTSQNTAQPFRSTSNASIDSNQKPKSEISETTTLKSSEKLNESSMYPTWSSG